ncbi:MAG: AmmeMemoRadiSam system protein A [Candidatus Staskawiczbacteria bacterium CG10_big_fil_rev_8_21_14_0_10_38_10]|uniref:AmmeMemoRadiSam system protein A n=1 Tax=Candidatus Staskawiczbacteria bacterium CG10_big_fil_rev_8_21_14_0_10_38_10 TaxID=1974891 RepID=A0A2H9T1U5_9BACT|nr:MAG: AmmeMemoRadiSam system protein A [Candidatus Staskawiczbacteria bacterium CG10_big_fil_rev_8_21_14_0_10_38_10]
MNCLVLLAKSTVENYINTGKIIRTPKDFPKEFLEEKSGVFVTIMKNNELRGCIGTYLPTRENIIQEVIYNAVAAATEDYRFGPIQREELPHLSYTVYALKAPELVKDLKDLDPKKYGIIVKTAATPLKSGLLLPDLDGIDTIEQQVSICCQKSGINPKEEKIVIYKFTVKKYS